MNRLFHSTSEAETASAGRELARALHARPQRPIVVSLRGELGAGKTELARAFITEWLQLNNDLPHGAKPPAMPSPTFNVALVYGTRARIAHLDLYRVESPEELAELGFEHYLNEHDCCLVEWLDRVPTANTLTPRDMLVVELTIESSGARAIKARDSSEAS